MNEERLSECLKIADNCPWEWSETAVAAQAIRDLVAEVKRLQMQGVVIYTPMEPT